MTTMLVTGGAGFIGSNFVRYWRDAHPGDRIIVLDLLTYAGERENLAGIPDVAFVQGDIADQRTVATILREASVDTVVNFAAETHVDRSIADPAAFLRTNVLGTHGLLEAMRECWGGNAGSGGRRFHHISTDEVFGSLELDDPAFNEITPLAPNSPYAASKAAADHLVNAYHRTYGLPTTISHCSNNFGPRQYPEKLIPFFIVNALQGLPLPIYGDGQNVRDWLYVEDHCRGIELILQRGRVGESYAIGGGRELTNRAIIDMLCATLDAAFSEDRELARQYPDAPPASGAATGALKAFVPDRPGHDRRYAIDDNKIRVELGYRPARDFRWDFVSTVRWYLNHPHWWRAILARQGGGPHWVIGSPPVQPVVE